MFSKKMNIDIPAAIVRWNEFCCIKSSLVNRYQPWWREKVHTCTPKIQDDPSLFDYNVDERVDAFIKDILLQAGNLRTNNVMFTFGSDFQYESAIENYKNIDKLMEYTMQKVYVRSFRGEVQVHVL
jgi:hypothetical protein